MTTRFGFWSALRVALVGALASALVACGGGGGSAGTPILGGGGGSGGGAAAPSLAIALSSTTVTAAAPATVTVTLKDAAGVALKGYVVTFDTNLKLGVFSAPSALTNDSGVATVQVSPANSTATGADTVVAKATVGGSEVSASSGFQLTATNVSLTSFTSDVSTLAAYGQTSLTVVLGGTTPSAPVSVSVNSTCVANGKASLTPSSVTTTTGRAVFTYRDNGCGAIAATDPVQVAVTGTTLTGGLSLALTSPAVSSIAFVNASPATIYLRGSGYVENSNVKFRVNDASGNGVPEQSVAFEATTLAGGLLLEGGSVPVTKKTDANGEVIVRINAGTVPTPVRVKATLVGSSISTVSSSLAVAVGLPSQLNFSLSAQTLNMEGYDRDGEPNTFTVIASDRLGNPVPEGTAVNFVSESGQVQATGLTSIVSGLGQVTANYVSASPRPADGRFTLVAYALGEESFLDVNGDNVYSSSVAEPFTDSNGNGVYDAGEPFVDLNLNGVRDTNVPEPYQDLGDIFIDRLFNFRPAGNGFAAGGYNGVEDQFISLSLSGNAACAVPTSTLLALTANTPSRPSSCVAGWGRAYVRKAMQIVLSTSASRPLFGPTLPGEAAGFKAKSCPAKVTLIDDYDADDTPRTRSHHLVNGSSFWIASKQGALSVASADANPVALNPVAAGSVISASSTEGLTVTVNGGSPVPNSTGVTGAAVSYKFDDQTSSGTVFISYRSPRGLVSTSAVSLEYSTDFTGKTAATCP